MEGTGWKALDRRHWMEGTGRKALDRVLPFIPHLVTGL